MDKNLQFIRRGKTGCLFASLLAKNPEKIGWKRVLNPTTFEIPEGAYIVSFVFENSNKESVRDWALANGLHEEFTSDQTVGLRYKNSWVQYFGPDAHVKTRQTPHSELLFCVKLPKKAYFKVGFKGVLHLAHASVEHIKTECLDKLWEGSFEKTKKILGYKPTIKEAAKTTWEEMKDNIKSY